MQSSILMEEFFNPGFKTKPAVHVGSQSMRLYANDPEEQAWENLHISAATEGDVVVARNIDKDYYDYWQSIAGPFHILNIKEDQPREFLSNVLLSKQELLDEVKQNMKKNCSLMVYFPTDLEEKVAKDLNIPLHGSPFISKTYGTKSGIRDLAQEYNLAITPGYTCYSFKEVESAIKNLSEKHEEIIIKHDLSSAGRWSCKFKANEKVDVQGILDQISNGKYAEGKDTVVVEGWIKSKVALCAHIEILPDQDPIICAGWQQLLDTDNTSYIGASPLKISQKAMQSFCKEVKKLANALKAKGAVGSYGPDFIVVSSEEKTREEDSVVLIELNGRVPITAFPLEIIKQVKGTIGDGFITTKVKLKKESSFKELQQTLDKAGLLILSKNIKARGVVPYNIGLLPWKQFYVVAMANTGDEAESIMKRTKELFL